MHTVHSGFTVAVGVSDNEVDRLKNFLRKVQQDDLLDFKHTASTLYASIVLLPAQKYQQENIPATLMFFTSFSGPFKRHLEELLICCSAMLGELFRHCIGSPKDSGGSSETLKKFMLGHQYSSTFYSGLHGITPTDIYREDQLRREIVQYINRGQQKNEFDGMKAPEIKKCIQDYIKNKGRDYEWTHKPCKRTVADFWVLYWKAFAFIAVLLLLFSFSILSWIFGNPIFIILLLGILLMIVGVVLFIESGTYQVAGRLPDEKLHMISVSQCYPIVNEMTVAGPVKKGFLRRLVFVSLLKVVSFFHGTIRIPTVCTARWVALNAGKRLIFISNYTNRSDSYVRDFIDAPSSARGINLIFGHGEGYPKTKWLVFGGNIDNPEGFMNVFHQNQHVTQYWYAPFKDLTVDVINNNRKIRNGLFAKTNAKEIQQWLNLL